MTGHLQALTRAMLWITRFDQVTAAFVEQRDYTDFAFQQLRSEMQSGFGRIERKLDMVIDRISDRPPRA